VVIFLQLGYGFPTRFYSEQGFRITSPFGPRPDPFNPGQTDFHTGTDYGGRPRGTPVLSTVGGDVFVARAYSGWGNLVGVTDAKGYNHLFAHLQDMLVKPGDKVARGDRIGTIGSTGQATGPHLHYQINKPGTGVRSNGYFGDPDKFYFEEEVENVDVAIVLGSDVDYCNAAPLRDRLNCPVFSRTALGQLAKVSNIYVCGGSVEPIKAAAPKAKIIDLSGSNRFETAAKISDYLKSL